MTGTWTKVLGNTVIDTQVAGNRANQRDTRKNLVNYRPTSVGLPSYMDDFCQARFECILPAGRLCDPGNATNYQDFGGTVDGGIWVTNYQGQSNLTHTRGSHTLRGGVDVQWAQRTSRDGAGNMGTFTYDNTYTRAADTTNVFPAQQIGLSLAAFMLGIPTSVSIADNNGFDVRNNYFGTFVQDTWRVEPEPDAQLRPAVRVRERHQGDRESDALLWFDPEGRGVDCGRGAKPPTRATRFRKLPASQFNVQGGTVYAGAPGYDDRTWKPEALWMPRLSFGYKLGEKNVIKGGYGVYYDTHQRPGLDPQPGRLRRHDHQPAQHRLRADVAAGRSEERHPAAGRSVPRASQRQPLSSRPVGNSLGARHDPRSRRNGFTAENPESRALARAAVAPGLAARTRQPHGARRRVCRVVCRPAGHRHPPGLSCPSSIGAAPTSATLARTTFSPRT